MRGVLGLVCLTFLLVVTPAATYGLWDPASHRLRPGYTNTIHSTFASRIRDGIIQCIWGPRPNKTTYGQVGIPSFWPSGNGGSLRQYERDVVLRFNITSQQEALALAETSSSLLLDVWEHSQYWADIRIPTDTVPLFLELLPESLRESHTPLLPNLAQAILETYPAGKSHEPGDFSRPADHRSRQGNHISSYTNPFFKDYQPLSVIHPWMKLMRSLFPTHVRLISLGASAEGRDILALRVGVHPTNAENPIGRRKTVVISAGSHAREWISTAALTHAAYSFITAYGRSERHTKLIEAFDWVFVPTLNPDGYAYTWEHDRLWRKNRQETTLRFCKGIDIDRSFNFQWDGATTQGNPCSESYAGELPLEAVEASRLADWVANETEHGNTKFVSFLDLHSYSQQVLYPYSYSCVATPPTLETLEELGLGLAKAFRQAGSRAYDVTAACEGSVLTIESAADAPISRADPEKPSRDQWPQIESGGGSALDYMYYTADVHYAYQVKLRDRGSYGFLLPSKEIVPSGKELFAALTYLGTFLLSGKGIERNIPIPANSPARTDLFAQESRKHDPEDIDPEADVASSRFGANIEL